VQPGQIVVQVDEAANHGRGPELLLSDKGDWYILTIEDGKLVAISEDSNGKMHRPFSLIGFNRLMKQSLVKALGGIVVVGAAAYVVLFAVDVVFHLDLAYVDDALVFVAPLVGAGFLQMFVKEDIANLWFMGAILTVLFLPGIYSSVSWIRFVFGGLLLVGYSLTLLAMATKIRRSRRHRPSVNENSS